MIWVSPPCAEYSCAKTFGVGYMDTKVNHQPKPLYEKEKNSEKEMIIIITKNTMLLKEMNAMVELAETEMEY